MKQNKKGYHSTLSRYFASNPHFFDGDSQKKPHIRKCSELPWQQTKAALQGNDDKLWDNITETLCDLDFIQAKACAKLTYDLVKDYHFALDGLPEYQSEKEKERKQQERMEKYAHDLIACDNGEMTLDELEIPASINLWPQEQINAEINRIKTNPTRADKLKDVINFLGQEADNLQNYADEYGNFSVQQAWNWGDSGLVSSEANAKLNKSGKLLFRKDNQTRPIWSPLPLIKMSISFSPRILRQCTISPESNKAVVRDEEKNFVLINLKSGEVVKECKTGLKAGIIYSCISSNCDFSVMLYQEEIFLWNIFNEQLKFRLSCPDSFTKEQLKSFKSNITDNLSYSLDISANNRTLISSHKDNTIRVSYFETGIQTKILASNLETSIVKITPDGKLGVSYCNKSMDNKILIWDLVTGEVLKTLKCSSVSSICITPDLKFILCGSYTGNLYLVSVESSGIKEFCKCGKGVIWHIDMTADGRIAICSVNDDPRKLFIWDLNSGELKKVINVKSSIYGVKITPDGRTAISVDANSNAIIWDLQKGYGSDHKSLTHDGDIEKVFINSTGRLAFSSSTDESLLIWDFKTSKILNKIGGHSSTIKSFDISFDNKKLVTSGAWDETIIIRNLVDLGGVKINNAHNHIINQVIITPDCSRVISCSDDQSVAIWDIKSGKALSRFNDFGYWVRQIALTVDGKYVFAKGDNIIKQYDLQNSQLVTNYSKDCGDIDFFTTNSDGKSLLIFYRNGDFVVWSIITRKVLKRGNIDVTWRLPKICLAKDGRFIYASFSDHSIRRLSLKTGKIDKVFKGHKSHIMDIQISPNNKYLVSCGLDKNIILWDIERTKKVMLYPNNLEVKNLCIGTDGIITGDHGGNVFISKIDKHLISQIGVITLREIWDYELNEYLEVTGDCIFCGHRFNPDPKILGSIEMRLVENNIQITDSPCLSLPDEAWEHPSLLSECPKCKANLKCNPFIAGGE